MLRWVRRSVVLVPVLTALAFACARPASPVASDEISTAQQPPAEWAAGVNFEFLDRTHGDPVDFRTSIRLVDGTWNRALSGRDLMSSGTGAVRTPWYRLRPGGPEGHVLLHVELSHAGGGTTKANYDLPVLPDGFYYVRLIVARDDPTGGFPPRPLNGLRAYPLDPSAAGGPDAKLWIGFLARSRQCFDCPT